MFNHDSLNLREWKERFRNELWEGFSLFLPPPLEAALEGTVLFPGGSVVKNLSTNAGDVGLIPGLGRFPGGGNGNPLQYSDLESLVDRGTWWATVHGVANSWMLLSTHALEGILSRERERCSIVSDSLRPHGLQARYWSGQLFPSPRDLPNPGIECRSPSLQADSFFFLFSVVSYKKPFICEGFIKDLFYYI